jgi:CheY-like chemotaxis protein
VRLDSRALVVLPLVLIVDDYLDALDMYAMYLSDHGFRVATASCGAEGIASARAETPALILMDVQMADMLGTEALAILRADSTFDAVPIIAFTAQAVESQLMRVRVAGFDSVILKPCLPDDLAMAINHLIATRRGQHQN